MPRRQASHARTGIISGHMGRHHRTWRDLEPGSARQHVGFTALLILHWQHWKTASLPVFGSGLARHHSRTRCALLPIGWSPATRARTARVHRCYHHQAGLPHATVDLRAKTPIHALPHRRPLPHPGGNVTRIRRKYSPAFASYLYKEEVICCLSFCCVRE